MTIMLWHHLDNQKPDTGVVHQHLLNTVKDTLYQIMDTMYPTNYHAISKRIQKQLQNFLKIKNDVPNGIPY